MHHTPCRVVFIHADITHPTPPFLGPSKIFQLRVARSGLNSQNGQQDLPHTPRRQTRRNNAGGGTGNKHFPGHSHSCSPSRRAQSSSAHPRSSPPPYNRQSSQHSPSKQSSFQASTATQGQPVCALCLATETHDTRRCHSKTLWDGSKARCRKNEDGRLITPTGNTLCSDWNNRRGCSSSAHDVRHECSGCGRDRKSVV